MTALVPIMTVVSLLTAACGTGPLAPTSTRGTEGGPGVEAGSRFVDSPLSFIENRGQVDPAVDYYLQGVSASVAFGRGGVGLSLSDGKGTRHRWGLALRFLGAEDVRPVGRGETPTVVSYFTGEPDEWVTGLHGYARVTYRDLWPGIDLVYSGTGNELKYSFEVAPGADPADIRLAWQGASELGINERGQLEVMTGVGSLVDDRPVSYQEIAGGRVPVTAGYDTEGGGAVGFEVGPYDPSRPLVIDPAILLYAGFVGGDANDNAQGVATDAAGSAYIVGYTDSTAASFPGTVGPDLTYNDNTDAFVAKVNPAGTGFEYAGYIGGDSNDYGRAVAVDGAGNAYVTGRTSSTESGTPPFPVTAGSFGPTSGGSDDAFVAKVNPSGSSLAYAGFLGGDSDEQGNAIAVDGAGNAYLTGETSSTEAGSPPFPVTPGSLDGTHNGDVDAFVAKINPAGSAILYAGYLGGQDEEEGQGIAVDASGSVYVVGDTDSSETDSPPFPVTPGSIDPTLNGSDDGFVAKVNPAGSGLVYATFLGGDNNDAAHGVAVDAAGDAYVAGGTCCGGFPVTVGPDLTYSEGGAAEAFVAKVNPSGSVLVFAGYIGGTGDERAEGIALDPSGNVYVAGKTWSTEATFPVALGPDLTFNGGSDDAFIAKVNGEGTGFVYAGYIGGTGEDRAEGVAVDEAGNAFVVGSTDSTEATFPVSVGPDLSYGGDPADVFVAKVETTETCKGRLVTGLGGPANEALNGTSGPDVILALGGKDSIKTLGGKDVVCAGEGNDKVSGGGGKDKLFGEFGRDRLNGGGGNDKLNGGPKRDVCIGGLGKRDRGPACEKERSIP